MWQGQACIWGWKKWQGEEEEYGKMTLRELGEQEPVSTRACIKSHCFREADLGLLSEHPRRQEIPSGRLREMGMRILQVCTKGFSSLVRVCSTLVPSALSFKVLVSLGGAGDRKLRGCALPQRRG